MLPLGMVGGVHVNRRVVGPVAKADVILGASLGTGGMGGGGGGGERERERFLRMPVGSYIYSGDDRLCI